MSSTQAPVTTQWGAATDPGLRRALNEDSYLASSPVFVVADGMGGHHAGEVASAAVVAQFERLVGRPSVSLGELRSTMNGARKRVHELPTGEGASAGTTLSGVVICEVDGEGYWLTVNVGDSRTYRLSDGVLEQVSIDHTVVQELVDSGALTSAAARGDSRRNIITRAIGAGSDSQPDYWLIPADAGDRILVCSDGLPDELDDEALQTILLGESDPQDAATRLVHEAMLHGGRDNITALVVDATAVQNRAEVSHDTTPSVEIEEFDGDTRPRTARGGRA
ncbi:PP2C family protein-serine/threonine phosphatase (plasmid) [Coraliomargarita sp. W4R53]